jgi:hypothetical protein
MPKTNNSSIMPVSRNKVFLYSLSSSLSSLLFLKVALNESCNDSLDLSILAR